MLIDQNTFLLLKSSINRDGLLELPAYGNSMYPYIKQGDKCSFTQFDLTTIEKGDVILFITKTGQLIAHRYVFSQTIGDKNLYICKGDTNLRIDNAIEHEQILGKLVLIKKHNITLKHDQLICFFWGKLILAIPFLSEILRKYLNFKLKLQF